MVGMVVRHGDHAYAITAAHVLKERTEPIMLEDCTRPCHVLKLEAYDIALLELPHGVHIQPTKTADAKYGEGYILAGDVRRRVLITSPGSTLHYFVCIGERPAPGESGAPLVQNEGVVGILNSVFLTGVGVAISTRVVEGALV